MAQKNNPKHTNYFFGGIIMKEHFLTLFLALTTGITIFIFTLINSHQDLPVFDFDDILFEHQTMHGNIVVASNAYDEFVLSFSTRGIGGMAYAGSSYGITHDDISFMTLPANANIPFTTHAVVSSNPNLHEIIVMESGSRIAHRAHAKKTTCEQSIGCSNTAVFLVSSVDLTGNDALIVGLDSNGTIIVEIEIP